MNLAKDGRHFERPLSRILRLSLDELYLLLSRALAPCLLRNAFRATLSRILRLSLHEHLVIVSVPLTPYLLRNAFRATPVEDSAFLIK